MTLADLKPGQKARVLEINGQGVHRRRLLDMGITPNVNILVRKVAPMGDPMELFLRNYVLTLRHEDASKIEVEVIL